MGGSEDAGADRDAVDGTDEVEVLPPGAHGWFQHGHAEWSPDGSRLVIARGRVDRTFIQAPGGKPDDQMRAITDDISRRMQALDH